MSFLRGLLNGGTRGDIEGVGVGGGFAVCDFKVSGGTDHGGVVARERLGRKKDGERGRIGVWVGRLRGVGGGGLRDAGVGMLRGVGVGRLRGVGVSGLRDVGVSGGRGSEGEKAGGLGAEKLVGGDTTSDNNRFCIRVKFEGGGGFFE